jgi:predicted amidophosphoribosyltransferase
MITEFFAKQLARGKAPTQQYGSQRMCPFCGLITPRSNRLCLECGKPLRAVQIERKDARQG